MIKKMKQLQRIMDKRIIAVIRADSAEQAVKTAEAVLEGGIDVIEITMTVPGALGALEILRRKFPDDELLPGAGTVLDAETTRAASLAGASFIVSPGLSRDVIRMCNRYQLLNMTGCMTVSEIIAALEAGADIIKLFPGNLFGPSIIRTFRGPLPQAEFIPTGGVTLDNVKDWLNNGCLAVGVGGDLTGSAGKGDFEKVARTAREFVQRINTVR